MLARVTTVLALFVVGCRSSTPTPPRADAIVDASDEAMIGPRDAAPDTSSDGSPDSGAVCVVSFVPNRDLGTFPRDREEPDFDAPVTLPSGDLTLSFALRSWCEDLDVEVKPFGKHLPIHLVLERGAGSHSVVARADMKLVVGHLRSGRFRLRLTNDEPQSVTPRVVIDTCHGTE